MKDKIRLIYNKIENRIDEICDDGFVLKENQQEYETLTDLEDFIDSLPEQPISEDLDYLVISLEETIGTSPHSREVIKEHLQKAAEWQKQKSMQGFLEKAEEFLYLQLNNGSIECGNIERLIDDFKKLHAK